MSTVLVMSAPRPVGVEVLEFRLTTAPPPALQFRARRPAAAHAKMIETGLPKDYVRARWNPAETRQKSSSRPRAKPEAVIELADRLTIGRSTANQLVLEDQKASRSHAEIRHLGGGRYRLSDLGQRQRHMAQRPPRHRTEGTGKRGSDRHRQHAAPFRGAGQNGGAERGDRSPGPRCSCATKGSSCWWRTSGTTPP